MSICLEIDVNLTESNQSIEEIVRLYYDDSKIIASFEYSLIPHYCIPTEEDVSYEEMFLPSEQNDTILVVEEQKLHVNKAFLSYHSDYFRALFSSNYKKGQMNEITIEKITVKEFGLLLSTVYPNTVFPNDQTVEKLLELADRFLMPSATAHVEYHLLNNSRIRNEKLIWMADKFGMSKLLDKSIREVNTFEKAKQLKEFPEYNKLSDKAKAKIFDTLMLLF